MREQEEAARREANDSLQSFLGSMRRQEIQETREKEEAAARRQEEERHTLEHDVGVVVPRTPPPRVICVGAGAPVSEISEVWH